MTVYAGGTGQSPAPPELVREALRSILASRHFGASARLRRFLSFVVEETLAGRQDRIKAYSVAIEVFGRDQSFDAQNDPVVRIEAGRLRRALEHYHIVAGHQAPVVISIPKGAYVPVFTLPGQPGYDTELTGGRAEAARAGAAGHGEADQRPVPAPHAGSLAATHDARLPTIAIMPFHDLSHTEAGAGYAAGIVDELLTALSRYRDLRVFGMTMTQSFGQDYQRMQQATYVLEGSIRSDAERVRVNCRLLFPASGAILWTTTLEASLRSRDLFTLPADLGARIASAIGQPYGIVASAEAIRLPPTHPDISDAYLATRRYYLYRNNTEPRQHFMLRNALETVVARHPDYAVAWAMLSFVYLDEERFNFNRRSEGLSSLAAELHCAQEAFRLDPSHARCMQALIMALYFNDRVEESLALIDVARATNPSDMELMAQIGQILAMSGRLSEGRQILEQALELAPNHTGTYHDNLAFTMYLMGDYPASRAELEASGQVQSPLHHAIAALTYAELGLEQEASAALASFQANHPEFVPNLWAELSKRHLPSEFQSRIAESFRRAGAQIPDPPDDASGRIVTLTRSGSSLRPGR